MAGRSLRNRVVATAHGTAAVVDGMPMPSDVEYWGRLARGGPAMVVAGGISVGRTSTLRGRFLGEAWHPHAAVAYRPKAEAITSGGAVAIAQLCHLGRETLGAPTFLPFEAPSAVRSPREPSPARVLTTDDCAAVVDVVRHVRLHDGRRGFRRRRDPWGPRLPGGSVPEREHQRSHRPLRRGRGGALHAAARHHRRHQARTPRRDPRAATLGRERPRRCGPGARRRGGRWSTTGNRSTSST